MFKLYFIILNDISITKHFVLTTEISLKKIAIIEIEEYILKVINGINAKYKTACRRRIIEKQKLIKMS